MHVKVGIKSKYKSGPEVEKAELRKYLKPEICTVLFTKYKCACPTPLGMVRKAVTIICKCP